MKIPFKVKAGFFVATVVASNIYVPQLSNWVGTRVSDAYATIRSKYTAVKVVEKYVPERKKSLNEILLDTSTKYNIPHLLLSALITQESGKGLRHDRMRYEPKLQPRFKRESWMNDSEYQALATSWGYGQIIYGIWKDFCDLNSYSELLDPETNVECSARILRSCLDRRNNITNKADRYKRCLSEYNGDGTGAYAQSVLDHLAELVINQQLS